MKKSILLILFLFCSFAIAQNDKNVLKSVTFSQKIIKKRGLQLVLKSVTNDSRCPEGVNCIWAGECEIEVAVYKNRKLISTENILLSPKMQKENIDWFQKYYPRFKIKEIGVLPYPKNEVVLDPKDNYVKIFFE